jgi:hypothetical protein
LNQTANMLKRTNDNNIEKFVLNLNLNLNLNLLVKYLDNSKLFIKQNNNFKTSINSISFNNSDETI